MKNKKLNETKSQHNKQLDANGTAVVQQKDEKKSPFDCESGEEKTRNSHTHMEQEIKEQDIVEHNQPNCNLSALAVLRRDVYHITKKEKNRN